MGPKQSLEWVFFCLKSPAFLVGVERQVLGVQYVTKVVAISDWNGLYDSMRPGSHRRSLDLVVGAIQGAQWVRNNRLRGSFLA